jgi:hypothetical protein
MSIINRPASKEFMANYPFRDKFEEAVRAEKEAEAAAKAAALKPAPKGDESYMGSIDDL